MVSSKTLIGVITGEYARRADYYDYFNILEKPDNSSVLFVHERSPAKGRNVLIDMAIKHECTHILFVDDDMAYKHDALLRLLEHDKDIVSGLYFSGAYPHIPMAFDVANPDDGTALPMYLMPGDQGLKPIVAAGFGFLLVKTWIFDMLQKPYVRLGELVQDEWCDDIGFFKRVREAGIESFVDLDVMCGHMKSTIIWPNRDEKGDWYTAYDTNGSGAVNTPQFNPNFNYKTKQAESMVGVEK